MDTTCPSCGAITNTNTIECDCGLPVADFASFKPSEALTQSRVSEAELPPKRETAEEFLENLKTPYGTYALAAVTGFLLPMFSLLMLFTERSLSAVDYWEYAIFAGIMVAYLAAGWLFAYKAKRAIWWKMALCLAAPTIYFSFVGPLIFLIPSLIGAFIGHKIRARKISN